MKTEKVPDLLNLIKECLKNDSYKFSKHALERKDERIIEISDVLHVLTTGYHEKQKDIWDFQFNAWNYAVRGTTIENENLRIIVSFDERNLLIITLIRLE